jgi:hypothetical protein
LILPTAGIGYTLKFTGRKSLSEGEALFYSVFSKTFDVSVGDIYKLSFDTFLGNAFGGSPFTSNPAVGLTDRGGNIIRDIDGVEIVAQLTTSPSGVEKLLPSANLAVDTIDGVAKFTGLHIMESGGPYQISFTAPGVSVLPHPRVPIIPIFIHVHHVHPSNRKT